MKAIVCFFLMALAMTPAANAQGSSGGYGSAGNGGSPVVYSAPWGGYATPYVVLSGSGSTGSYGTAGNVVEHVHVRTVTRGYWLRRPLFERRSYGSAGH
jgi:hypothetical protein